VSAGRGVTRRLFFALWPNESERGALLDAFGATIAAAGGRAVLPSHLHLTLEFLGAVPDAERAALETLGAALALPEEVVVLDRLHWWARAATLVVAPGAPGPGLLAAQVQLRETLKGRGFRVDSRPFRPHVTLARKVRSAPPLAAPAGVAWRLNELALVESLSQPQGSRYVPLARWARAAGRADFGAL
jgi:2'-5' RNA ligase